MSTLTSKSTVHCAKEIWSPQRRGQTIELVTIADAAMVVNSQGKITALGSAKNLLPSEGEVVDHGDAILVPGFVDAHLHCPQLDVIGSGGYPLLEWLDRYVFPAEQKFKSVEKARNGADRFVRELKRHGVTTAAVFSTVHAHAADALFTSFAEAGLRLICGKTSMDVGAPREVLESAEKDIEAGEQLIAKWHGKYDRLFYAITPRFALSCSKEMMESLGALRQRHPSCYVQTHVSENLQEVHDVLKAWKTNDYLEVYENYGLVGARTLLAHGIYLSDSELSRLATAKASVVHCPSSNMFLGSGLFNLNKSERAGVRVCLGSDIGGGTSVSPWHTMLDCYKVQALQGHYMTGADLLFLATLAGAETLGLESSCGSLEVGKDADFVVLRPQRHELLMERLSLTNDVNERMFACVTYGDDRIVEKTFVAGRSL